MAPEVAAIREHGSAVLCGDGGVWEMVFKGLIMQVAQVSLMVAQPVV